MKISCHTTMFSSPFSWIKWIDSLIIKSWKNLVWHDIFLHSCREHIHSLRGFFFSRSSFMMTAKPIIAISTSNEKWAAGPGSWDKYGHSLINYSLILFLEWDLSYSRPLSQTWWNKSSGSLSVVFTKRQSTGLDRYTLPIWDMRSFHLCAWSLYRYNHGKVLLFLWWWIYRTKLRCSWKLLRLEPLWKWDLCSTWKYVSLWMSIRIRRCTMLGSDQPLQFKSV